MHAATYISASFVPLLNGSVPGQGHWVKPHEHRGVVRLVHGIIYLSCNIGSRKSTSYAKELKKDQKTTDTMKRKKFVEMLNS